MRAQKIDEILETAFTEHEEGRTDVRSIAPLVCRLSELAIGATARVVFILPKLAASVDQLAGLGLLPGTELHLRQKHPSRVVEIGETVLALDAGIAASIFVQRIADAAPHHW